MTEMNLTGAVDQLFSVEIREQLDAWIAKYPADQKRSALIPSLHILQAHHDGWLSKPVMKALAVYLELPEISVFEVATFYSMFYLEPVGRHKINVCTNISCQLCGSEEMVEHLEKRLGVKLGETTKDGLITLREVECLGACVGAPMLQFDQQYHEHLTTEKIDAMLETVK